MTSQLSTHSGLHKAGSQVDSLTLSVDGRLAVSAGRDGKIGVVDIVAGALIQRLLVNGHALVLTHRSP
jgi:hypothetical protein